MNKVGIILTMLLNVSIVCGQVCTQNGVNVQQSKDGIKNTELTEIKRLPGK